MLELVILELRTKNQARFATVWWGPSDDVLGFGGVVLRPVK
jgi:hypothetical protein